MEITEKLQRLHEHVQEHPADYQSVIAELKLRSKAFEHQAYMAMVDKKKRIAENRKRREAKKYAEQNE